jgi:hypothetical protein
VFSAEDYSQDLIPRAWLHKEDKAASSSQTWKLQVFFRQRIHLNSERL